MPSFNTLHPSNFPQLSQVIQICDLKAFYGTGLCGIYSDIHIVESSVNGAAINVDNDIMRHLVGDP